MSVYFFSSLILIGPTLLPDTRFKITPGKEFAFFIKPYAGAGLQACDRPSLLLCSIWL
jgi:hypothetical protein